jgi:hypothetical protein
MIWADRAGLAVTFLVFVVLFILIGALGAVNSEEIWPTARVALVCVGLVWTTCRTVDFIFGGSFRREQELTTSNEKGGENENLEYTSNCNVRRVSNRRDRGCARGRLR